MTERWRTIAAAAGLSAPDGAVRPTIFAEMSALAAAHGAANLGQGFPDSDGPEWIRRAASEAIMTGANQYPPGRGIPELRNAVADHRSRHYGLETDPDSEVLITAGATEALTAAILAFAGPGDEVVTLEPFYDSHAAAIATAGATHVTVPLHPGDDGFRLDPADLDRAVGDRTRMILVNTPHNPTGTVLKRDELEAIGRAAEQADAIVLTDEVYEHLVFDEQQHIPIESLPRMRDRTLTVSSSGKTFSLTGWKIGWVTGPAELIEAVVAVKQFLTYVNGAPFQPAIARALTEGDADIAELRRSLATRRDLLVDGLRASGFDLVVPDGTYFVCADASPFIAEEAASGSGAGSADLGLDVTDGASFARALPERLGVACVPVSAFCREGSASAEALRNWVRFTFVKDTDTLHRAIAALQGLRD